MFNTYIELIISLIVIYALLSVLVSLMNEIYRNVTRDRGKMMYDYVRKMLRDDKNVDITYLIFRHPLIENTRTDSSHKPSYIDPKIFASALIQTVGDLSTKVSYTNNNDETFTKNEVREVDPMKRFLIAVNAMHAGPLKSTFLGMAERADLDKVDKYLNLENQVVDWFNYQMRSLTSFYKHKQRKSLLFFGFVVTFFLNIDSLHLVHELRNDPKLRMELTDKAEYYARNYNDAVADLKVKQEESINSKDAAEEKKLIAIIKEMREAKNEIDKLELPIGYSKKSAPISWFYRRANYNEKMASFKKLDSIVGSKTFTPPEEFDNSYDARRNMPGYLGIIFYFFGLLITGFSLSMGAPFWFDLLNKAVSLKRGGK